MTGGVLLHGSLPEPIRVYIVQITPNSEGILDNCQQQLCMVNYYEIKRIGSRISCMSKGHACIIMNVHNNPLNFPHFRLYVSVI